MNRKELSEKLKSLSTEEKEDVKSSSIHASSNRDPKELVSLSGVSVTTAGKISKSNFFNFLDLDLDSYDDIQFTPEEAKRVSNHLSKLKTGSTAMVPLYCSGSKCPFADRCPLQQINKAPVGRVCPIESTLLKEYIVAYFSEFDVDPDNWTEVAYVQELAEIDIYLTRLNMALARPQNAELVVDQMTGVVGHGDDAEIVVQKQISPFMEMKDRLLSRRSRIIKLMVGDRQEQYKRQAALKVSDDKDISSQLSAARAKLDSILRLQNAEVVESGTLRTPDDYMKAIDADED